MIREYYNYPRSCFIEAILDEMDLKRKRQCSPDKHLERKRHLRSELIEEALRGEYIQFLTEYWSYLGEFDDRWE